MMDWQRKKFQSKVNAMVLHSDSSDYVWAGVNVSKNLVHDFWRGKGHLHINWKDL